MRMLRYGALCALCSLTPLIACGPTPEPQPAPREQPRERTRPVQRPQTSGKIPVKTTLAHVGLDVTVLDRKVKPCDDFYKFACGGWIKRTKIPGDKPRWVRAATADRLRLTDMVRRRAYESLLEKRQRHPR